MRKLSVTSKSALEPSGELLSWDTEFWGQKIARAGSSDIDKWAKENMVGCVCLLVSADDTKEIQAAEGRGFRFMDVRVTLSRPTGGRLSTAREFRGEEIELLVRVARESHRITRFYADPRFPNERCDDLYENWIRASCSGWADTVLVVNAGQGYCSVHTEAGAGKIGLIAVTATARGRGLGAELVDGAIDWCYTKGLDEITVVTQGRNIPALRLFEKCGFRFVSTEIWMHRWFT